MTRLLSLLPLWLSVCLASSAWAQDTTPAPPPTEPATQMNPWDICNETSFVLRFASAYVRDARMQTQGWTTIQPGACTTQQTPVASPRFLYAESLNVHRGGIREWKGTVELCATEEDFTSDATDNCRLKNFETRNYFAVKPSESQTAFIEPSDFGDKADVAGLQRLLQDTGYKITRVDGLAGRRTNKTIAEAKADLGLDKSATSQALITALIPVARKARDVIGLDICNDSSEMIYGAIAIQDDGTWTSRGWWPVAPGACAKPFDKALAGTEAHIFALQEAPLPVDADETTLRGPDRRLRVVTANPTQFCIAESKFSALGREKCLEQGYAIANFRPMPTDVDGQIVRLTDADFVEPGSDGLRR